MPAKRRLNYWQFERGHGSLPTQHLAYYELLLTIQAAIGCIERDEFQKRYFQT